MRPTLFGLRAALFEAVMVTAFFATHYSNLFFLLLTFLSLLGAGGLWAARRNVRGVRATLDELPAVPSHASAYVPVQLGAPGARFQLAVHVELDCGESLVGHVDLLAGEAALALAVPPLARGCYAVRRAFVESRHPFGLVRARSAFDAPRELLVYPAPRDAAARSAAEALDELLGKGDPGAGDLQPASLRDHRDGEGIRGVHWRASARRGRLVVQEWEGGSGQGLEVVLDRRCDDAELEDGLATISAMVQLARTNKETLRVHSQGGSATYGDGHAPWSDALRFLACAEALPASAPPPPSTSPSVARLPRAVPAHA